MRAGLLKDIVQIYRPTVTRNSVGEQVTTYTLLRTIHARNIVHRQTRTNDNGDVWLPSAKTIEVRIYQPINDTDLINWNGKTYRIVSIDTDKPLALKRLELEELNDAVELENVSND